MVIPGLQSRPRQLTLFRPPRTSPEQRFPWNRLPGIRQWWSPEEDRREIVPDRLARVLVGAGIVAYIWLFSYWTMRHHDGFGTTAFDFGLYDQGVWLLSRFRTPFVTIMGRHLFGDHTSFILLPLVPLYWIWASAKVLLVAQAAALGAGAVPVFLLAREKLRSEMAGALLAVVFLLQPALGWTNLEQFHPDVFEVPLALFAAWFMVKERWTPFLICVGALLLVKEDAFLLTLGFGLYVALRHDRRIGLLTCMISVIYAAVAFWVILPALNGVGTLNTWRIPFGGPWGLVRTAIAHPGRVLSYLFVHDRMWYAWQLLAPLALVPIFSPAVLLIALGPLASNLLSTFYYQYDIHYHYTTLVLPVLMVATIFAIAQVADSASSVRGLVIIVVAASLATAYLWGPTPLGRHEFVPADPSSPQVASVRRAIERIPDDAAVSAYHSWVPHVDHRERIYMFPNPWKAAYWGTFDREGQRLPFAHEVSFILVPTQLDPEPRAVLDSIRGEFETVYDSGGVVLLRRRA